MLKCKGVVCVFNVCQYFFVAPNVPFTVIVEVFKYDCANIGVSVCVVCVCVCVCACV